MPYKSVQHVLPIHAQEIYMSSFNNAYQEYKDKSKLRHSSDDHESVCHKVAWTAVKKKYKKAKEGKWVAKV